MPSTRFIRTKFWVAALAVMSLFAGTAASAQTGFVHAQGKTLVDGAGKPLLLRGTSLGNWLVLEGYMFHFSGSPQQSRTIEGLSYALLGPEGSQAFWQSYRKNYITRDDIQYLKQAGFNSIRIPLHYKFFTEGNDEGFALIDPVVTWAREAGMYVILDMHCTPGGQNGTNIDDSDNYPWVYESPQSQKQLIAVWTRIAAHYSDNPTVLGYDLLNEPMPDIPTLAALHSKLEPLYKSITVSIRTVDKNHVIILEGANWAGDFTIFGPPFDKNAMYSFHKYWMPAKVESIQPFLDYRDKYNVPLWLGESGENQDAWVQEFRELLEKNQVNWAFWPYKKMDNTSGIVSFAQPPHWDEIRNYAAHGWQGDGHSHPPLSERPSTADIHEAFDGLLHNIQFAQVSPNPGYLKALGMNVPKK